MPSDTLPEIYRPLMEAESVVSDRCAICGRRYPLEQHHIVWRSWGKLFKDGKEMRKPTVTLCGFGNNHDLFPNRRYHMDVWRARLAECKGMSAVAIAVKYGVFKSTIFQWSKRIRESEVERVGS